jgi:hypothetical protein
MNNKYISHIAESKIKYHKQRARMSYEEKYKILLALQKIDFEMRNKNKTVNSISFNKRIWQTDSADDNTDE